MYKLIALDLDGTLTDKNKNILNKTCEMLHIALCVTCFYFHMILKYV